MSLKLFSFVSIFCLLFSTANSAELKRRYLINMGPEIRQEKNNNNEYVFENLTGFGFGFGFSEYNFIIEKSQFSKNSGNMTLNVKEIYESYSFWAQYQIDKVEWVIPFFTAGVGITQNIVETELLGVKTVSESDKYFLTGIGCGFRAPISWIWLSAEARLVHGENWNPNPSIYLLGRVGIFFE